MLKIINKFISKFFPNYLEKKIQKKFQQALLLHQAEQWAEAQSLYLKILKIKPKHANSLHFLGVISHQTGDSQLAVDLISEAITINPNSAAFYSNLGVALMDLKHLEPALASYDKAIAINSNNADFHYNRGNILGELGKEDLAVASYDKAIELNSNNAEYYHNRGNMLRKLKQLDLAVASYDKAMQLNPDHEGYFNCGNALFDLKQWDSAISHYNKAIQLNPEYAEAYLNIGNIFSELKQTDLAITNYNKAIELKPDYIEAHHNCGNALFDNGQLDLAIISYNEVIKLKPDYKFLLGAILRTKNKICDWSSYDEDSADLETKLRKKEQVSTPFSVLPVNESLDLQLLAAEIYTKSNYPAINTLGAISKRPRSEKIRIGYYSADFHRHATSHLMAGLFESHDKSKFEIIAFSFGPDKDDDMKNRVSTSFDKFYDVRLKSDIDIINLSRELEIDVAIDLKGFTKDMRLGIFAGRCAPIQVNYLGYPGTMGATYIDYIIADKTLIPEENQKYYLEKIVYLPDSYQVNDDKRKISDTAYSRKELGLPEDGFIYCCFNKNYKITPKTFDGWMRILKAVEGSVLWLFEDNIIATENLRKEAKKRGVDSSRLIFASHMKLEEHLARHKVADLFLDTLPCNAHTTCSDALWAGLPTLTLIGQSFAGRVAASLLNAVNLPELIANTQEEYENLAIELATNLEKLKEIKLKLEENKFTAPLFNTKIFTNHIEKAYEAMYERYQNGLDPDHIYIKQH